MILRCAGRALRTGWRRSGVAEDFPCAVTEAVHAHPNIEVVRREATRPPEGPTVIATGPLTRPFAKEIMALSGETLSTTRPP